ncbi:MAG: hypothetical protein ACJ75J_04835 [Cytophagaceae bacterium]
MFGFGVFDIAIGLLLVYLILSLIATSINEAFMSAFSFRGSQLHSAIKIMLNDPDSAGLAEKFYLHPIIRKLSEEGRTNRPSYISRDHYSKVLMDILSSDPAKPYSFSDIQSNIAKLSEGETKDLLLTLVKDAMGDEMKLKSRFEEWYTEMMDRTTGWYKRRVHYYLFLIGLLLSISFNADTIFIARKLSEDPTARQNVLKLAMEYKANLKDIHSDSAAALNDQIKGLMEAEVSKVNIILGIGWDKNIFHHFITSGWAIVLNVMGWILTAFAISLGAPFWFDMLNKIINIRGVGLKPGEKKSNQEG